MKKLILFLLMFFLLSLVISSDAFCCSAFLMKGKNYSVVGFNENWKSMPGMVVINKRNVDKINLSWNFLVSDGHYQEPRMAWTSKYGSVSFNLLGMDLPCFGVNEKGLFIVELYLDKTFSSPDSLRPEMFWAQWIQYQLDNFSSVNELVKNLKTTPVIDWWPTFPGSHFFVSDRKGNTAAVELINGRFQVSYEKSMSVPVLCNSPYQEELKKMKTFQPFGGTERLNTDPMSWNDRFSKAANFMKMYNPEKGISPVPYAFNILDSIRPGQWQMVADIRNNVVYFRSDLGKNVKSIDISKCDFSPEARSRYIDINSSLQGDVTPLLGFLTPEINDGYVIKGFPVAYENADFYNSEKYVNLKKNLHQYVSGKLK